ncbi:hypothetical protein Scep_007355 [Stephania cephalantha]|uniref:Uncharacterized protein n=1 Tax=Stephania cephalantha TaxID=152367 RepID=A0AAP0PL07_9MAGN
MSLGRLLLMTIMRCCQSMAIDSMAIDESTSRMHRLPCSHFVEGTKKEELEIEAHTLGNNWNLCPVEMRVRIKIDGKQWMLPINNDWKIQNKVSISI